MISGIDRLRTLVGVGVRNGLAAAPRVCRNVGSAGPERPNDEVCSAPSLGRIAPHAGTSERCRSIRLPGWFGMDASVLNFVTGFWSDVPRSHTFDVEGDRTLFSPYTCVAGDVPIVLQTSVYGDDEPVASAAEALNPVHVERLALHPGGDR